MRRRDMIRNSVLAAAAPLLPLGAAILTEERAEAQEEHGAYTLRLNDGDILVLEGIFSQEHLMRLRDRLRESGKNNVVIITLPMGRASVFPAAEIDRLHDRIHEMRRSR